MADKEQRQLAGLPVRALRGSQIASALGMQGDRLNVAAAASLCGCTERRLWEAVEYHNGYDANLDGAGAHLIIPSPDREWLRLETHNECAARIKLVHGLHDWAGVGEES